MFEWENVTAEHDNQRYTQVKLREGSDCHSDKHRSTACQAPGVHHRKVTGGIGYAEG